MRRRTVRPYGATVGPLRLVSLIMAVGLLWVLYGRFKDPATWRWLTDEKPPEDPVAGAELPEKPDAGKPGEDKPPEPKETVVPGPNDLDEEEREKASAALEVLRDRSTLQGREMPAYWTLARWSRTQTFAELWKRSTADVATTQLWQQPEKYRAKPVRMRLHVTRVLEFDAPENPLGVKRVVECWGWTDESRSIPYVAVLADPPDDLPRGTDVRVELNFAGYFLKNMAYQAFDKARSSPLFIGRGRIVPSAKPAPGPKLDPLFVMIMAALGAVVIVGTIFLGSRRRGSRIRRELGELPDEVPQEFGAPAAGGPAFDRSGFDGPAGDRGDGPAGEKARLRSVLDTIDLTGETQQDREN